MTDKEKLMRIVQMYRLAVVEANLFLDTHPMDKDALDYYNKNKKMCEKAMADYTEKFGPISLPAEESSGEWKWATEAWPWEVTE